jgi:hypothetical protein
MTGLASVRGLIRRSLNAGIGLLGYDLEGVRLAVKYLDRFERRRGVGSR